MSTLNVNGAEIYLSDTGGSGDAILFIHGLMLASESWEAQVAELARTHRVLTFDLRGQGRSEKTRDNLDLDSLAADTAVLIDTLKLGTVHVVAFSMGTFIAMRLAARRPDLVRSLTLIGPSADAEEWSNLPKYLFLINYVRLFGTSSISAPLMKILFGRSFLADPSRRLQRERWESVVKSLPRALHRAAAASAGRKAIWDLLPLIRVPTLVVSGEEDRPISPGKARKVHEAIAGSRFASVPDTGHAVMIEQPAAFNRMLKTFLLQTG